MLFSPYSDAGFVDRTLRQGDAEALEVLEGVWNCLEDRETGGKRPRNWEDCVTWARLEWETLFNNEIRQLLHFFPSDEVKATIAARPQEGAVAPVRVLYCDRSSLLSVMYARPCRHWAPTLG